MNVLVVFDDTNRKSEAIRDVIGDKGFSEVIVKKHRLEEYYRKNVLSLYPNAQWHLIKSPYEFQDLLSKLSNDMDMKVLHCFSNFIFTKKEQALLSFEKLKYIDESYCGMVAGSPAMLMFSSVKAYRSFLKTVCTGVPSFKVSQSVSQTLPIEGMVNIGSFENFIQCITGSFDSRYFNSVTGNTYTLVKRSTDKRKIKAEYEFYRLLPDDMKAWFVMPYNYREDEQSASYTMEHLHMTDLAIKWVHGSIDEAEFKQILEYYFHFFMQRHPKIVTEAEYQRIADKLYVDKVQTRIAQLKEQPAFKQIESMLETGSHETIDDLVDTYFKLKKQIEDRSKYPMVSVIGHGDPCFANTLYSKTAQMLKFIDPKGALTEKELWTNPYYDIAKLSHSICGLYDFFNNGLFEIRINKNFQCELDIEFDNQQYMKLFREKLEENGYDYLTVRIYEASLFLSMLPLHIDNPFKVFGFILNARRILKEIEHEI